MANNWICETQHTSHLLTSEEFINFYFIAVGPRVHKIGQAKLIVIISCYHLHA